MAKAKLVRVKGGFDTDLFETFYYLEARLGKDQDWRIVVDDSGIVSFTDKTSAEIGARDLLNRLTNHLTKP